MKLQLYNIVTLLLLLMGLFSCTKNEDNRSINIDNLSAQVKNASSFNSIAEVKLLIYDISANRDTELAFGDWKNDGFTIVFPKILESKYLHTIIRGEWWWSLANSNYFAPSTVIDTMSTISISNKNIKITDACFSGVNKDGLGITFFSLDNVGGISFRNESFTEAIFTYVDSDVTIYGYNRNRSDLTKEYSINWKRGWNVWYRSVSHMRRGESIITKEQWTTTPVNGLKWYGNSSLSL